MPMQDIWLFIHHNNNNKKKQTQTNQKKIHKLGNAANSSTKEPLHCRGKEEITASVNSNMWFPLRGNLKLTGLPVAVSPSQLQQPSTILSIFIFPFAKLLINDTFIFPSVVLVLPSAAVWKLLQHGKLFKSKKTGRRLKEHVIAKCTLQSAQEQPVPNSDCTLSNRCRKDSKSLIKSLLENPPVQGLEKAFTMEKGGAPNATYRFSRGKAAVCSGFGITTRSTGNSMAGEEQLQIQIPRFNLKKNNQFVLTERTRKLDDSWAMAQQLAQSLLVLCDYSYQCTGLGFKPCIQLAYMVSNPVMTA